MAHHRLDTVASGLRKLLHAPFEQKQEQKLLPYRRTGKAYEGYLSLAAYPLVWVDADAFEWNVEQAARLDRFGQDALTFWERAYQLGARGAFLPDEGYSEWATPRRERLAGQYRQCVHRLVQLLREQGVYEEALLRLRNYWQEHQTDEDALRVLIEMLAERERYQEAERYYEQAREALEEDGLEPDEKTRDVMALVRAVQIQGKQSESIPLGIDPIHQIQAYSFRDRVSPSLPNGDRGDGTRSSILLDLTQGYPTGCATR